MVKILQLQLATKISIDTLILNNKAILSRLLWKASLYIRNNTQTL